VIEHQYGVVLRKGWTMKEATVSADSLESAFGKAAVIAQSSQWPENADELSLVVRRINSPRGEPGGNGG
jgi:hypothetical protein